MVSMKRISRRELVSGAGAAATALLCGGSGRALAAGAAPLILEARTGIAQLSTAFEPATAVWGYQGRVPGPVIRARQGDEVAVTLVNRLEVPTTIHWHGIRIDNRMDGVAHLTQEPVQPGESFDYSFTVPDAGTFWYHPHVHGSGPQVDRGLSGILIVEEIRPPGVDTDVILQFDDWRLAEDGQIDADSFGSLHDAAHAGRLGNVLTVNGKHFESVSVQAGERLRLRVVSTCNARILQLDFARLSPWIVALDGQPVAPHRLDDGLLVIGPGQRADLIADVPGQHGDRIPVSEVSGQAYAAMEIAIDTRGTRTAYRGEPPPTLPDNPVPVPDRRPDRVVDLVMEGGAMRFLDRAEFDGQETGGRELAMEHGMVWAMNGVAGMPETPLFSADRGEPVAIRLVNRTLWPHAMHLHGHHFVVYDSTGQAVPGLRDTVLVQPEAETVIGLVADNPGRWMLHCHMLEHQAAGMETWFDVSV